jgi:hypothetical protein
MAHQIIYKQFDGIRRGDLFENVSEEMICVVLAGMVILPGRDPAEWFRRENGFTG